MERFEADEIIKKSEKEKSDITNTATSVVEWLLSKENIEHLYKRSELASNIHSKFDVDEDTAKQSLSSLVGDGVDPVQQVVHGGERYVGILDYRVYDDCGAYGYIDFDDVNGRRKRLVCSRCVEKEDHVKNIVKATEGEETCPEDCSWGLLKEKIKSHYDSSHSVDPSSIEPGASLLQGTSISSNLVMHLGIGGSGSGFNVDSVDGFDINKDGSDGSGIISFKT